MKKFLTFGFIVSIAPLIGGIYGVLHDQFTYTISDEYYTKFKFYQFGLWQQKAETVFQESRVDVSIVGFLATWWMGVPIGIILGSIGFIHTNHKDMFRVTLKAYLVTILIAFFTGLIGLAFGYFYLSHVGVAWWLPENLENKRNFIAVGSMHNFSYLGGLLGLVVASVYSIRQKRNS